jgi:hypothetical protein
MASDILIHSNLTGAPGFVKAKAVLARSKITQFQPMNDCHPSGNRRRTGVAPVSILKIDPF